MATHSSILNLENSMDRGAWWATVHGVAVGHDWKHTHTHTNTHVHKTQSLTHSPPSFSPSGWLHSSAGGLGSIPGQGAGVRVPQLRSSMHAQLFQSFPTLCNPTDSSLLDLSVLGILQTRILEWVAVPFSKGSSWPWVESTSLALQADSLLMSHGGSP